MVFQFSFALVLGARYLDSWLVYPVGFTAAIAVLGGVVAYWSSGTRLSETRPPRVVESLPEMVRGLETSMDASVRRTYIIEDDQPRAEVRPLLLHRSVDLYVTTALFEELDVDAVAAVLAHELAHVNYHDHHYRTFSALIELGSAAIGGSIIFWVAYEHLPAVAVSGTGLGLESRFSVGAPLLAGIVVWWSGSVVAGAYRRTAEIAADTRAGQVASYSSMFQALVGLEPENIVGPSPGVLDRMTSDYPLTSDRVEVLMIAAYTEAMAVRAKQARDDDPVTVVEGECQP